jgi:hypothetical protein
MMNLGKLLLGAGLEAGAITLALEAKDRAGSVMSGKSDNAIKDGAIAAACSVSAVVVAKEGLGYLSEAFNNETALAEIEPDMDPEIPVLDGELVFEEVDTDVPEMEL